MTEDHTSTSLSNQTAPGKTILLVEDEKDIANVVKEVLMEETPHRVFHVPDGKQALALLQTITPDLFILNYSLPMMNGLELFDHLHAIKELEHVPALLVSAAMPPQDEIKRRHIVSLRKPFDLDTLLHAITSLLPA